jgi:trypsin-like peptidase
MWQRLARTLGALVLCSAGVVLAPGTPAAADPSIQAASLASTIALSNCSASLVRFPSSVDTDRAMMLTNGHCFEGGFINNGVVVQNRASTRSGTLLNAAGTNLGTVRADLVIYGTMTGTDVLLYRLTQTFAAIRTSFGQTALTISSSHPVAGTSMYIPSSFHKRIWNCSINGFVPTLRESQWTWRDSIRYNLGCDTIPGTSGTPVVDLNSNQVVGINNTLNENGQNCTLDNPCEVDPDGTTHVIQGQAYGQETYWFNTCLNSARTIDLTVPGCLLFGANGGGGTTVFSDNFETSLGWTTNPNSTDTAVSGAWERGDPETTTSGVTLQVGTTPSGTNDLVTARLAGGSAGANDVDGGVTSVQSPAIALPSTGTLTLTFAWYLAHLNNATSADFFRVSVVSGTTSTVVFTQAGAASNRAGSFTTATVNLTSFAGQTIRLRIEAADNATGSLLEAGVDDVRIAQS